MDVTGGDIQNTSEGRGLGAMEESFCQAYTSDAKRNATQAALSAGYSEKTAGVQACQLLKRLKIKARIRELEREALRSAGYGHEEVQAAVMREYIRIAFSDVTDIIHISPGGDDPNREEILRELAGLSGGQKILDFGDTLVVPSPGLSSDVTAAVKSIKVNRGRDGAFDGFDISMHDKLAALRVLAEASGLVKNQISLADAEGGPVTVKMRWMTDEEAAAAERTEGAGEAEEAGGGDA
ncbi:MAG: terminase small subunit [Synergistaceae bacterium]|nr:terminase small subunit [Synergistaceae bacterium]